MNIATIKDVIFYKGYIIAFILTLVPSISYGFYLNADWSSSRTLKPSDTGCSEDWIVYGLVNGEHEKKRNRGTAHVGLLVSGLFGGTRIYGSKGFYHNGTWQVYDLGHLALTNKEAECHIADVGYGDSSPDRSYHKQQQLRLSFDLHTPKGRFRGIARCAENFCSARWRKLDASDKKLKEIHECHIEDCHPDYKND
ncbi:hypothetical protein [Grimontia sp. SpTr1]|uniref:hypothetical protein n=1 Tax=Grimontia sp. SpTr1 TaxID=2995319 RepID=UPI00248C9B99|nr:hypothetical protein [Grimontia sp. SpTr1]